MTTRGYQVMFLAPEEVFSIPSTVVAASGGSPSVRVTRIPDIDLPFTPYHVSSTVHLVNAHPADSTRITYLV